MKSDIVCRIIAMMRSLLVLRVEILGHTLDALHSDVRRQVTVYRLNHSGFIYCKDKAAFRDSY